MKIAIDGRCFTSKPTGVANFAFNALNSISKDESNEIFILAHKEIEKETYERIKNNNNVHFIIAPFPLLKGNGIIWFFFSLSRLVKRIDPDLFWSPGQALPFFLPKKIKKMLVVHDFVFKQFKNTMAFKTRLENTLLTPYSIKKADFLWCNSNYTRDELLEYFPHLRKEEIFVGCGIDLDVFFNKNLSDDEKKRVLNKFGISGSSLLFVGTLEPRKNLEYLLKLMPRLVSLDVDLLIVGSKGWGNDRIYNSDKLKEFPWDKIKFCGFVQLSELVDLYNSCEMLICPSLNEGFGLPLVEAMACGCPVIAAHNSAMIEIVENFGITVKGWNGQQWINAVTEILQNRDKYSARVLAKRNMYDWDYVVNELFSFLANKQ